VNHLNDQTLGARLDGALTGRALEEADRHLAGCARCREALAALSVQDESLAAALAHDPGEAYFATFAARVEDRLRAEGLRGAQKRLREEGWLGWWTAPRRMAWAAAVATVVAGAAIVLITSREQRMPLPDERAIESRIAQEEATAPAPEGSSAPSGQGGPSAADGGRVPVVERERAQSDAASRDTRAMADESRRADAPAGTRQEAATPTRMREVGGTAPAPQYAQPPLSPAPAAPGGAVRVGRRGGATPMSSAPQSPEAATMQAPPAEEAATGPVANQSVPQTEMQKSAPSPTLARGLTFGARDANTVSLCGHVFDPQGRAVARAVVTLVSLGRTAHSDEQGNFCLEAPAGSYELSVLAVGFEPERLQVRVGGERSDVQVTLRAISVLDEKAAAPDMRLSGGTAGPTATASPAPRSTSTTKSETATKSSTTAKAPDPFAGETEAVAQRAHVALSATSTATRFPSRVSWEKAILAWNEVAGLVKTPAGRNEARWRLAEAWVSEWRYNAIPQVKNAAMNACMQVLSGQPTPRQRSTVMKWMDEMRRGLGPPPSK
jgi:hypothetical protein